jgi:BirA family transcriptional regulator, biotin operon repressor / biotin---[acetyl-CoA-carboxylase] ligase
MHNTQPLNLERIAKFLAQHYQQILKHTQIFSVLPSTNTYLLERAKAHDKSVLICLAEKQTRGRGQFTRQWFSAAQRNICLSALWSYPLAPENRSGLSIIVAVAVVRALKKIGLTEGLGLKWPNDVQWHGKKLAGILIESCHQNDFIIGIGLNVAQSRAIKKKLSFTLTDLQEITGAPIDRNQLTAYLIECLFDALQQFTRDHLQGFLKEWLTEDVALNQPVTVLQNEKKIQGIYRGIDPISGALLLENRFGILQQYLSGEVSLRVQLLFNTGLDFLKGYDEK